MYRGPRQLKAFTSFVGPQRQLTWPVVSTLEDNFAVVAASSPGVVIALENTTGVQGERSCAAMWMYWGDCR